MIISKRSWHYRLNDFMFQNTTYIKRPSNYQSLCTYFWHTVWIMLCSILYSGLALALWSIPKTPAGVFHKHKIERIKQNLEPMDIAFNSVISFFVIPVAVSMVGIALLVVPLSVIINTLIYGFDTFTAQFQSPLVGLGFGCYAFVVLIATVGLIIEWIDNVNQFAQEQPENLIVQFAKAKKNKICPRIEFKD